MTDVMRRKILIFCDYYMPGLKAGGPITTIRNMTERLSGSFDFFIVTRDRDLGDTTAYPHIVAHQWQTVDSAQVLYIKESRLSISFVRQLVSDLCPDAIYLNSALSRRFTLIPLLASAGMRVVLAPRGEFSAGALSIKSLQKKAYLGLMRASGLWRNLVWQASSPFELNDIEKVAGKGARVRLAPDLPSPLPPLSPRQQKREGVAMITFAGRISAMKNPLQAIRTVCRLEGAVTFNMVGPVEDARLWQACQEAIRKAPPNIRIIHHGAMSHALLLEMLARSDALFLPSLGENFAHVVFEAFSAGCPVVISDRTPWRNLQEKGVGFDCPLEPQNGLQTALQMVVNMSEAEHDPWRTRARAYAQTIMDDETIVRQNEALFQCAINTSA